MQKITDNISTADSVPRSGELAEDTVIQLKMAGQVQRSFLPSQMPNSDKIHWATLFKPADWVSGDIYDVTRLDEQHIGFYVADAVGHSVPAALLTIFLKQAIIMRETIGDDNRIFGPVEVIRNLNKKMVDQHLTGNLFATCCYGLLNIRTLQMTYARAGHPYPILIRKDQQPAQLKKRGGLLGIFPEADFQQQTIQLEPGDKLFIYSDGCDSLIGECDDKDEFIFNQQFLSITDLPVEQMLAEFELLVNNMDNPVGEIDDITAVALQIL